MQRSCSEQMDGSGDVNGHIAVDMEEVTGAMSHLQQAGYSRSERVAQEKAGLLYGRHPSDHPFQGRYRSRANYTLYLLHTGPTAHLLQEGYSRSEHVAQEKAGVCMADIPGRHPSAHPSQGQSRSFIKSSFSSLTRFTEHPLSAASACTRRGLLYGRHPSRHPSDHPFQGQYRSQLNTASVFCIRMHASRCTLVRRYKRRGG